jgi:hypothetical protein
MLSASAEGEDGEPEITIAGLQVDVYCGPGQASSFAPERFPAGDALWSYGGLAIGDLTHDGRADLALSSVSGAGVLILPGAGDGSFGSGFMIPVPVGPLWTRDLDRSGRLDLVSAIQGGDPAAWIWWNGGPE